MAQDNVLEVTKLPTESVEEIVRTLPSLEVTAGIILISAAVAVMVVWGIRQLYKRNQANATNSEAVA